MKQLSHGIDQENYHRTMSKEETHRAGRETRSEEKKGV